MASLSLTVVYLLLVVVVTGQNSDLCQEIEDNFLCHCQTNCSELDSKIEEIRSQQEEQKQLMSALHDQTMSNQNNTVVHTEEQMSALHQDTTAAQQQMTEMQQQIMADLQTQRRMMSVLETKVSAINSTVVTMETPQQQMTEMQQQMMAELQTQRRIMSALETRSKPKDCADIQREELSAQSGVHTVFVGPNLRPVRVFCDLEHEGGGWLVFQRRKDGSQNFQQNWDVYARGFGNLLGEFWLGNDFLHLLTEPKTYTLRFDMEDFDNDQKYAEYSTFRVGPASDKYRLRLGDYSGDAGDSMTSHSGHQFSTIDQDNDDYSGSCSSVQGGGGGWWYGTCLQANLNGLYLRGENTAYKKGVIWLHWRGTRYSLKTTVMKIRPANY